MSFHSPSSTWTPAVPAKRKPFDPCASSAVSQHEIRIRRAIREVNSLDERTLIDIGLARRQHGARGPTRTPPLVSGWRFTELAIRSGRCLEPDPSGANTVTAPGLIEKRAGVW